MSFQFHFICYSVEILAGHSIVGLGTIAIKLFVSNLELFLRSLQCSTLFSPDSVHSPFFCHLCFCFTGHSPCPNSIISGFHVHVIMHVVLLLRALYLY